MENTGLVN